MQRKQSSDNNLVGRLRLFRLTKDVYWPSWLVCNVWDVETAWLLLANSLNLLEILFRQLDFLEVLLDARYGDRLGDNTVATDLSPRKDHLSGGSAVGLCNLLDGVVLDEQGKAEHVVAKSLL